MRAKKLSRAWMSAKYRLESVAPYLTQPCLASVQPCSITARSTACLAAMIATWPAPSDEPVMTVFDHTGSPLPSTNCPQPSAAGRVRARYASSLLSRFSMLLARLTLTIGEMSPGLARSRISVRALIAQSDGRGLLVGQVPAAGDRAVGDAAIGASLR